VFDQFERGVADVFLISLKAGGTGLNLVSADTVIHYDPWWNPAAQAQATDRAYRIGQTKPVFVYNLIVAGSVEERMLALQERKRHLANTILGGQVTGSLSEADVDDLFAPIE
jgi:SNF2 family DNA or RNA helicase